MHWNVPVGKSRELGGIKTEWDTSAPICANDVNLLVRNMYTIAKNTIILLVVIKVVGLRKAKETCNCMFLSCQLTAVLSQCKDSLYILQKFVEVQILRISTDKSKYHAQKN